MRIVAIVQARMSSARLPGKVLRLMLGRPMLSYLVDGLRRCRCIDGIILATSGEYSDDRIVSFAKHCGVEVFRGALDDVAARLLGAARQSGADAFVRVNGDSPLLDPALVDQAATLFRTLPVDVVSNVFTRSFPKGQSVEVVSVNAFEKAVGLMSTNHEREHVTPYLYAHSGTLKVHSFVAPRPRPEVQLSVDDEIDFGRCEAILSALQGPHWDAGWERCVKAYDDLVNVGGGAHP